MSHATLHATATWPCD